MSDYGTMQARIADEIARADLASQIRNAIQSAIEEHTEKPLYFLEATEDFSLSVGAAYITTTDFPGLATHVEIQRLRLTQSASSRFDLRRESFADIDSWDTNPASRGMPGHWTYWQDQLRFYPIPDMGYLVTAYMTQRLAALSADSDTNAWMTAGERLIRHTAKKILWRDVIMDAGMTALCQTAEDRALADLTMENYRRVATGRIKATRF